MIESDYKIVQDNGMDIDIFEPNEILKRLPDKVNIRGPNSKGKSTLLHIIGAGFYGIDNEKIPLSLQEKMRHIMSPKCQLTFKIKILNDTLTLISEKLDHNKSDFNVYEISNGESKELSIGQFRSKYNVIYNIPENPIGRFKEFPREIEDSQRMYYNRLKILHDYVKHNIAEINNRDPDKIKRKQDLLKERQKEKESLLEDIRQSQYNLNLLEYATYHRYQEKYDHLKNVTLARSKKLQQKIESRGAKLKRTDNKYYYIQKNIGDTLDKMRSTFDETSSLLRTLMPKNEYQNLNMWGKIDFGKIKDDLKIDKEFRSLIATFKLTLNNMQDDNKTIVQEIELYQNLIKILEKYNRLNINIPGTELSISEFIELLNQSLMRHNDLIRNKDDIKKCMTKLDELKNESDILERLFQTFRNTEGELNNNNKEEVSDLEKDEEEAEKLRKELVRYTDLYKTYTANMAKSDFKPEENCNIGEGKLKRYEKFSEQDLSDEITTEKEDILSKIERTNNIGGAIINLEDEIKHLNKQEPHEYENYIDKLKDIHSIILPLLSKFGKDFQQYLKDISKCTEEDNVTRLSQEQKDYYDALSSYLGKRVCKIRHMDREYEIEKLDLINKCFISKNGAIGNFLDMGTGQGQLAYLLGMLNLQDDRKIILLLDEVAMMDRTTLGFLNDKINELYDKDRLLVGIVVQAKEEGDQIEISDI